MTKKLTFTNYDATETGTPVVETVLVGGLKDAITIMQWYGGFYAGDEYIVTLDGKVLPHDANGEYLEPMIGGAHGEISNKWQLKDVTPEAKQ